MTTGQARPLPVRLRPQRGETADSYVRRLASANHLRFSYLRRYLSAPAGSYGPLQPGKLAAVTGRDLPAILHALPDLATPLPRRSTRRYSDDEIQRNRARKNALFTAIRHDADAGMSGRAIERKHRVGRRTTQKALTSSTPPPRKKMNRESVVLNGLHAVIDAMTQTNPQITVTAIWEHLADELDTTVAYPTLRAYITRQRLELRHSERATQELASDKPAQTPHPKRHSK
jgi:hypothetical protein